MFVHLVFFWLKPGHSAESLIQDCGDLLSKIPGVRSVHAGKPAMTPRDVVDNSYAVGLSVLLDDVAAHDLYQAHPLHLEFVARNKPGFERIRVFDFVTPH